METTSEDGLVLPSKNQPLHFTQAVSQLCLDLCRRVDELQHIDMSRVLVTFARCRNKQHWGFQAKLVPMRFEGGTVTQKRGETTYQIQKYFVGDVEMLYVLTFYLPRFLNQSFEEKLVTVIHELYHICPNFSGDIRRFAGSCCVHTRSQKEYDAHMAVLARKYLAKNPPRRLYDFLRLNFAQLEARHGSVVGVMAPSPKLVPIG
jgi:hypothetical protein